MIGRLISKSKVDAYSYLPQSVLAFPDKLSLKKKMELCGLEDVTFFTRTLGIVTIHIGKNQQILDKLTKVQIFILILKRYEIK